MRRASVLLVDDGGRILLRESALGGWEMPGGVADQDETFEDAAYRTLAEETGIRLEPGHLWLWREQECSEVRHHVYVARVDVRVDAPGVSDRDGPNGFVELGALSGLDLSEAARYFVPQFVASATYLRLAGLTAPAGPGPA